VARGEERKRQQNEGTRGEDCPRGSSGVRHQLDQEEAATAGAKRACLRQRRVSMRPTKLRPDGTFPPPFCCAAKIPLRLCLARCSIAAESAAERPTRSARTMPADIHPVHTSSHHEPAASALTRIASRYTHTQARSSLASNARATCSATPKRDPSTHNSDHAERERGRRGSDRPC
jgi:hypothetical protein